MDGGPGLGAWDFYWPDGSSDDVDSDTGSSSSRYSAHSTDGCSTSGHSTDVDGVTDSGHSVDGMSLSGASADAMSASGPLFPGIFAQVQPEPTRVGGYQTSLDDEPWVSGVDPRPPPYTPHGLYNGAHDTTVPPPSVTPSAFGVAGVPGAPEDPLFMWDGDVSASAAWAPAAPHGADEVKLEASAPPPSILPLQWSLQLSAAAAHPAQVKMEHYVQTVCQPPKARPFDSSTVVPPPLLCPFCNASRETSACEDARSSDEDAETKRRSRRERKQPRANFKLGQWWKGFGYVGPRYCQRCSEVFRDHLIRQQSNSANCTRKDPCNDCAKVLDHFEDQEPWGKIDAREEQNRLKRKQKHSKGGVSPPGLKKSRMAAAMTTVAVVLFVGFHPEYLRAWLPALAPSVNCDANLADVNNSIPAECPSGPVGTVCHYGCIGGHEKKLLNSTSGADHAENATVQHVCRDLGAPNFPRELAYTGGVCVPCAPRHWSAGGDTRCAPCRQCPLGYAAACTASADAVCVVVSGPYDTSLGGQPPHVIDAATFVSASGERYLFGGQGPVFTVAARQHSGDAEGYLDTLVQYTPPVGIEGVAWKTVSPRKIDVGSDGRAVWPVARAGAMVWRRDESRWFMFGGNRAGTTGMADLWSFDASPDTPYWTKHCPDPSAPIPPPPPGTVGMINRLRYRDFPHVCSTANIAPLLDPYDPVDIGVDDGQLDLAGAAAFSLQAQWPFPRSFGTITAVPCSPNSPAGCTTNQAWLFGGTTGYDHEVPARFSAANNSGADARRFNLTKHKVMEGQALNDLWHLEWDQEGSVNWQIIGPYGPQVNSYVSSRGQGDQTNNIFKGSRDSTLLWPSSRSGHAAWAAADGRLFIFGGVGLTMRTTEKDDQVNMLERCTVISDVTCPCAMLADLWTLYPKRGEPQGNEAEEEDDLLIPFFPTSGWSMSRWGWLQAGSNVPGAYPDIPGSDPPVANIPGLDPPAAGHILAEYACMNHWRRQMPLEDWPDKDESLLWYNSSGLGLTGTCFLGIPDRECPLARRAAVVWTDPDSQTGWMYGGENMFAFGTELLSDLWSFDLSPSPRSDSDFLASSLPVQATDQVHTPPGKGAQHGLPMTGRAHAMAWVSPHAPRQEQTGAASSWPVIFGGAGYNDYRRNNPTDPIRGFWPQPASTDPWTTAYLKDVWMWTAEDDPARPMRRVGMT